MRSTNCKSRKRSIAAMLSSCFALLVVGGIALGQGGTGRDPIPKPVPKTTPAKSAAGNVVQLAGTIWGFEIREGTKLLGKGVFEFLPGGKLRQNGDDNPEAQWKQIGRRIVVSSNDKDVKVAMEGIITGNQISATIRGRDEDGYHEAKWTAKRADAELLTELSFWKSVKDSKNPEDFKRYMEKYPYGVFMEDAVTAMRDLEKKRSPAPGPADSNSSPKRPSQAGIEFVLIPAGSFRMGSDGCDIEKPMHQVTIGYTFFMGKYEVTQAQWQAVMGTNPSYFKDCPLCPVEQVSWNDAQNFVTKLNQKNDGFRYRLPSESEWEYAGRAGSKGDYAGDLNSGAWYGNNSGKSPLDAVGLWRSDPGNYSKRLTDNGNHPHPVGAKLPNAFGLYDMHGNVWEWCEDSYHPSYDGAPSDGSAWLSGGQSSHVLRGGSWYLDASFSRSANRYYCGLAVGDHNFDYGLRVVAVSRS